MKFKKILSVLSAIAVLTAMTGCGDSKKGLFKMEYGATMQVNKTDLPFPIEFDNRFLSDEEATAIVNYFYSIQEHDVELANQATYPDYLELMTANLELEKPADYLEAIDSVIASDFLNTEDYTFSYITIISCYDEKDGDVYTNFSEIDKTLEEATSSLGHESVLSKVKNRKFVSAEITCLDKDGNSVSLTESTGEQQIYVYTIDGKAYVL